MGTATEIVTRQRAVAVAMARPGGVSFHNVRALAQQHGVKPGTIWADRRAILARFASELDMPAPMALAEWQAQLSAAIANASTAGSHSAVLSGLALQAKVTGLDAPKRAEVMHAGEVSITGLSDAQAAALRDALRDVE